MTEQTVTAPQFKVVEQPKGEARRTAEPNPYIDTVKELHAARQTQEKARAALAVEVEMGEATGKNGDQFKGVNKTQSQLRKAGEANNVTVRSSVELNKPKKGKATVTFWTTKRIERTAAETAKA